MRRYFFIFFSLISIAAISQPANDDFANAIDVTSIINSCSSDAAYTTIGGTGDLNEGSCHNVQGGGPRFNVWFSFTAPPSGRINVTVDIGSGKGTQTYTQAAIWDNTGLIEVACKRYAFTTEDVVVASTNLTPGALYYITVDTYNTNTDGTFTLCLSDQVDYDFYEGAIDVTGLINSCSADAAYTTIGASGDRNEGSCHNVQNGGPRFNRWFSFTAPPSGRINVTVDIGSGKGTQTYTQAAIWDNTGLIEVACKRYAFTTEDVVVASTNLTPGALYYITVDTYNTNTDGTFTLCLSDQVDYDFYEGAIDVTGLINSCSADAAYTTIGASGDRNEGSCHNVQNGGPRFNRWFSFTAPPSGRINVTVDIGSGKGTQTYTQAAIWDNTGLIEVACKRYAFTTEDVVVASTNLTPGALYYITVDTYNTNTDGTFTLCLSDQVDYDFYEGAIDVTGLINSCSADAAYTTIGASGDRNEGSCHNVQNGGPRFNRWFSFTAPPSGRINVTVDIGSGKGTQTYTQAAIWDNTGLIEVACKRYAFTTEDVVVASTNLTPGALYYITVDTYNTNTDGTFTLCLSDQVDYDFYEGAIDVTGLINSCSADAAYTTIGASGDRNEGSCHNVQNGGPRFNRWFSFTAPPSGRINVTVDIGSGKGTQTYTQAAIWDNTGLIEVACKRYAFTTEDVVVASTNLTPGALYYITVDTYNTNTDGTFTLCLSDQVDYDFYEGAILIADINNWCSSDAAYTTIGASGDRNEGSCHNVQGGGPRFNRWFYFVATTNFIDVTVDIGSGKGTQTYTQLAIWESDGLAEVACKRYAFTTEDVKVGSVNLTPGNTYYITVDTYNTNTDGTFTLCVNDEPDYDFYEGAIELTDLNNWCSPDAAFSTIGASGDRNEGSCHNVQGGGPRFNRWFRFTAVSTDATITVDIGSGKGTQTYTQLALWESDGTTEVACQRYVSTTDDVSIAISTLIIGNEYYITVDTYNTNTDGTFTLCIDNISQEYYSIADGAWSSLSTWSTTEGGSPAPAVPSIGDVAYIKGYDVTLSSDVTVAEVNLLDSVIDNSSLTINGATLTVQGQYNMLNIDLNNTSLSTILSNATIDINDDFSMQRDGGTQALIVTLDNSSIDVNNSWNWDINGGTTNDNSMTLNNNSSITIGEDFVMDYSGGNKILNQLNTGSSLAVSRDIIFTLTGDDQAEIELNDNSTLFQGRDIIRPAGGYGILDCNGTSTVNLNSDTYLQTLAQDLGSGVDEFIYQNITISNSRITEPQVTLEGAVIVNGNLTLTDGIALTTSSNLLTLLSGSFLLGGNSGSYIDGPVKKIGNTDFVFHVGNGGFWAPIAVSNLTGVVSTEFTAEYVASTPTDYLNVQAPLNNISSVEYWDLSLTGTSDADVTLYWNDQVRSGIDDYLDLRIAHYTGAIWENLGQSSIVGASPGNITVNSVSTFSPFTFGSESTTSNPLPVELIYLEANTLLNHIEIKWATATEINNEGFEIERSSDGEKFQTIGKVQGEGNSQAIVEYSFIDQYPLSGLQYYRLKQFDFDGTHEYSDRVSVRFEGATTLKYYPNPINESPLKIYYPNKEVFGIKIYNLNGHELFDKKMEDTLKGEWEIPLNLKSGIYILEIMTSSGPYKRKLIKN